MSPRLQRVLRAPLRGGAQLARLFNPVDWRRRGLVAGGASAVAAIAILLFGLSWWWSLEPETFSVQEHAQAMAEREGQKLPNGYVTTATLIEATERLLNKPGGYITNDVLPPGVLLDNMPAWEYGAVVQIRDLAELMRNEFSRAQTQSKEDRDLAQAEPRLNFNANSWIFPSTEGEYQDAIDYLNSYRDRLAAGDADFYARADNLQKYLSVVGQRLGGIAQRLSASVGEWRANTDLAGEPSGESAREPARNVRAETPYLQIDNEFYHARGATWALLHFLRAMRADFASVLADKNADASLDQIIRALEATQKPMSSPVVLNGEGFGLFANHSLVMASYISRANAGVIDLRKLLEQG